MYNCPFDVLCSKSAYCKVRKGRKRLLVKCATIAGAEEVIVEWKRG